MQLNVSGKKAAKVDVNEAVFGLPYREGLVHQAVTAYRAGARQGSKAQKNRSDVSGGGAKPWRQKGTGRARAGTTRSPLWRHGGVTFAARPRSFDQKMNRKMYRRALAIMLSELARSERLIVVESFELATHKTKDLVTALKTYEADSLLIVTEAADENISRASGNLHFVNTCSAAQVNPLALIAADKTLITLAALKQLEERLS